MPRHSEKPQYKIVKDRIIFLMRSPLTKEFIVGFCEPNSLLPIFRQHCAGDRNYTNVCFSKLKRDGLHPCLTILREVKCTKADAYKHVVAWTKLLVAAGFEPLNTGNILNYIEELKDKSQAIYNEIIDLNLGEICSCNNCIVRNYARKKCPFYLGE